MKALLIATVAVAGLAVPAENAGGWKKLDGQQAPKIAAKTWLNAMGADTVASLGGKVYLLEFFATW